MRFLVLGVSALALPLEDGAGVELTRLPLLGQEPFVLPSCPESLSSLLPTSLSSTISTTRITGFFSDYSRCVLVEKQVVRLEVKRRKGNFTAYAAPPAKFS